MTEYFQLAPPAYGCKAYIGAKLFVELHRRLPGPIPRCLSNAAFNEGDYCLDAPLFIPCGACKSEDLGEGDFFPAQLEIPRCQP